MAISGLSFHDPQSQSGPNAGRGHIGTHPANTVRLTNNKADLRKLYHSVGKALTSCNTDGLEILFCKSGRHRSVALAACLQRELLNHPKVRGQPDLQHLINILWEHMSHWCHECVQCTGSESQEKVLSIAKWMIQDGGIVQ